MDSTRVSARLPSDPTPALAAPDDDLDQLVRQAAAGDQDSWNRITERFTGLVWAVARSYRLNSMDAADVVQNTWLRLVENLARIERPSALPKWLTTTARREALTVIRRRQHVVVSRGEDEIGQIADEWLPDIDALLLDVERDRQLWTCFRRLAARDQVLLRLLMESDRPHYPELAEALDMPVGSIGPTRMRALAKLRQLLDASDYPFESVPARPS